MAALMSVGGVQRECAAGLDLGQKRDYTALAVVERSRVFYRERDPVTYAPYEEVRYTLRYLERLPLGTDYTRVVERVRRVVGKWPGVAMRLAVDATGVGAAVVDLLRREGAGCPLTPVVITAGERAHTAHGTWFVPKADLLTAPVVLLEKGLLRFCGDVGERKAFEAELLGVRQTRRAGGGMRWGAAGAGHDDLVMALALGLWQARLWRRDG